MRGAALLLCCIALCIPSASRATRDDLSSPRYFRPIDVFQLEYASDPQVSPDGKAVVYVRNFMDVMEDRRRSNLWIVSSDGSDHRPLTSGNGRKHSPRWSPDGSRLLFVARSDGMNQIYLRWMDTGQTAKITNLTGSPAGTVWSPDGRWIAFSMLVEDAPESFADMPPKPKRAKWAPPPRVISKLVYRADGAGYLENGYHQLFVLPADGGTPRQITSGPFHHQGPFSWTPDGRSIIFSANRHDEWEYDPLNSEIYEVSIDDGVVQTLTDRQGPDQSPALSPDGRLIAYVGFDDREQGYQVRQLYVMNREGGDRRKLTTSLDRSVRSPVWSSHGKGIYFLYDNEGNSKVGYVSLKGKMETVVDNLGGTSIGRPYASGSFSVAGDRVAFTRTDPHSPADVVLGRRGSSTIQRLTRLNDDLFDHKELGTVEAFRCRSSYDDREIQGWIVRPPGFDPSQRYPLILEIHGGPFANYGDRFSSEVQLYASAGYVVVYANPRGSTSYGEEFGNLIHHNYPGEDYDDLMSVVDATVDLGYIDENNLFVTGGSGGGVLTAWIVGKTNRFRAAVVAKPVINWYSFVLTSDVYNFFYKYWFPGYPWDYPEHYLARSPLSLVGNVVTPTMLLTGEADYRTPMAETEQYYQALKLRKIDTALVRIPGASHGIAARPSNLIAKVTHILKWFESYRE